MNIEMSTQYNPIEVEEKWYKYWEENKCFKSDPNEKTPFTIMIPPPNVTNVLHMGHALNNDLQDVVIRFRKMQGHNALWLPGTDHAGIATQNVVERALKEEGKTRWDVGRDEFIKKVWEWRGKYGSSIVNQLKKLGCACDWDRERFTMDEGLSKAVREAFVKLYEDGLIYRGNRMINWCPRCKTALATDEVEYEDKTGNLWHMRYEREDGKGHIVVATTRPETMLGDTAVAVNPEDDRYKDLVGKNVILPIMNRKIPVIADEHAKMEFGTGAVKVTPSHDPNDFEIGKRHDLEFIDVMTDEGVMNENAGEYEGLDRFACRKKIVNRLKEEGLLEKIEDGYANRVGNCYRCHTVIEDRISLQWFVNMKPLAEKAIKVSKKGQIKFHPERWEKVYLSWLENVRDWCISRQIWWGHRIPVWYCDDCSEMTVSRTDPDACSNCGSKNINQDNDVLDTWFSSALWPFSTLGWPDKNADLDYYYPTDVLITARGIIYFWVARMVMMGMHFMNDIPFRNVYIHGSILDKHGAIMSKSKGNGIDPLVMIQGGKQKYLGEEYECPGFGADAVRFSLMQLSTGGQDIKLSPDKIEMGRNFCNKVWNACRFAMMNLTDAPQKFEALSKENLAFEDKWIISKLQKAIEIVTDRYENYKYSEIVSGLYDFIWREFCDWYLEIIKPRIKGDNVQEKETAQRVLSFVADQILRLLHPLAPFLTEEIWSNFNKLIPERGLESKLEVSESIMFAPWPEFNEEYISGDIEEAMELLQDVIRSVRNIRSKLNVSPKKKVKIFVATENEHQAKLINDHDHFAITLAGVEELTCDVNLEKPAQSATEVLGPVQVFIPLEGLVDFGAEKQKLEKELATAQSYLEGVNKKLSNPGFTDKAPEKVVQRELDLKKELEEKIRKIEENLRDMK